MTRSRNSRFYRALDSIRLPLPKQKGGPHKDKRKKRRQVGKDIDKLEELPTFEKI